MRFEYRLVLMPEILLEWKQSDWIWIINTVLKVWTLTVSILLLYFLCCQNSHGLEMPLSVVRLIMFDFCVNFELSQSWISSIFRETKVVFLDQVNARSMNKFSLWGYDIIQNINLFKLPSISQYEFTKTQGHWTNVVYKHTV